MNMNIVWCCAVCLLVPFIDAMYQDFVPDNDTHTCSNDTHTTPFNKQVRGVSLGGWLVLEPWITPSLFYQFLGTQRRFGDDAPSKTGMDMHSFCTALGAKEGNKQLRIHWKKWVTEENIRDLANHGLNSLRIPVGDWMFNPYAPYIGCTEGSLEELDRVLDLAHRYGLDVLLDIHGHIGSQNGFDNSGKSHTIKWTSLASTLPIGTTTFEHWPIRVAEWVGTFDTEHRNYSSINYKNIQHSLDALSELTKRYHDHPAMLGVEPINEPWELTPLDVLKEFYWQGYLITKAIAPRWKYIMHDSFRFGTNFWGGFMKGCPDIALDTHIYQAWNNPGSKGDFFSNACQQKSVIAKIEDEIMPVIVGEWSLATDNCAMWLNGFNDNLPGFPKVQCDYVRCPSSYLGEDFTGLGLDRTKPIQGPYGTGTSGPSFGMCPISNSRSFGVGDFDVFMQLGAKKLNAFTVGHGFYFWNFKNELDAKWDFLRAAQNGWLNLKDTDSIRNACVKEDNGEYICRAKRGVHTQDLYSGLNWICTQPGMDCSHMNSTFPDLLTRCDHFFTSYWQQNRAKGATCDFGGAASLATPEAAGSGVPELASLESSTKSPPAVAVLDSPTTSAPQLHSSMKIPNAIADPTTPPASPVADSTTPPLAPMTGPTSYGHSYGVFIVALLVGLIGFAIYRRTTLRRREMYSAV